MEIPSEVLGKDENLRYTKYFLIPAWIVSLVLSHHIAQAEPEQVVQTKIETITEYKLFIDPNPAYAAIVADELKHKKKSFHATSSGNPVVAQATGDFYYTLAMCETGGTMQNLNTGNGYYGYFQFSIPTWTANGGTGLPSDFDYNTQKQMAMKNINPDNFKGQHPACSRQMLAEGRVVPID